MCFGISTSVKHEKEIQSHSVIIGEGGNLLNSYQQLVNSISYCHPDATSPVSTAGVTSENNKHRHTYNRKWGKTQITFSIVNF